MILTRQEKEKQILDLYNSKDKTYKQIAQIVRVSPRDIKPVLEKAEREREKELESNSQERHNGRTENRKHKHKHKHKRRMSSAKHTDYFQKVRPLGTWQLN